LGLVAACGGSKPAATGQTQQTTAQAPAAAVADAIGVPECDEYLTKYQACIDSKVPEAARASLTQAFAQTREAWKQAAATPQGKQAMVMGCRQAMDAAKQAMSAYGCQW
jgi:hypothetical protein